MQVGNQLVEAQIGRLLGATNVLLGWETLT